jgi:antitoxin MazE
MPEVAFPGKCSYNVITMKAKIVDIGNSKGIRIPKALIEQLGLHGEVELESSKGTLVIRSCRSTRFSWAKAFDEMAKSGDDSLLDDYTSTTWDDQEWEWK